MERGSHYTKKLIDQETDYGESWVSIGKQLNCSKQLACIMAKYAIRRLWRDKKLRAMCLRSVALPAA